MRRIVRISTVVLAGLLFIAAPPANGQEGKETACEGKFKGGKRPTRDELKKILDDHSRWAKNGRKEGQRANLCEANLGDANLSKANLAGANLGGANLAGANLSGAKLLSANLSGAKLGEANLSGAWLVNANLSGAWLAGANLSGAKLWGANLSGAELLMANLSGAELGAADMAFSIFELRLGSLPDIQTVALARNLSKMTFIYTPHSMVELREEFKKKGLRKQEREITFAIKHTERIKLWERGVSGKIESTFQYILFEITSDYGMSPWRSLLIVVILIPLFSVPYMIGLKRHRRSGIWIVLPEDRVHKSKKGVNPIQVTANFPGPRKGALAPWLRVLRVGLYFSLLSAFRIGWRELNVGNWITRMQFREYILRATGWVRTVSGLQSLISVYLIALWILTYFGRPFE